MAGFHKIFNVLPAEVKLVSTKALIKDLINKYNVLNAAKYFSSVWLPNDLDFVSNNKCFDTFSGIDKDYSLQCKIVPKKSIKTPTSGNTFAPKVIGSNRLEKVIFKWNCLIQEKIYFIHDNAVNLYITSELDTWARDLSTDFTLDNCLVGAMKLTKSLNPDKYEYSGYGFDLKHVQNIHGGVVNGVKMLLFLGLMIVFLCILVIETKIS